MLVERLSAANNILLVDEAIKLQQNEERKNL
jgi:hypothetical protein